MPVSSSLSWLGLVGRTTWPVAKYIANYILASARTRDVVIVVMTRGDCSCIPRYIGRQSVRAVRKRPILLYVGLRSFCISRMGTANRRQNSKSN